MWLVSSAPGVARARAGNELCRGFQRVGNAVGQTGEWHCQVWVGVLALARDLTFDQAAKENADVADHVHTEAQKKYVSPPTGGVTKPVFARRRHITAAHEKVADQATDLYAVEDADQSGL